MDLQGNYKHPYGPHGVPFDAQSPQAHLVQIPFIHQGKWWQLIPNTDPTEGKPIHVSGAMLTSCCVEPLRIVEIEDWPDFTDKLAGLFAQSGYQMVRSR